MSTNVGSVEEIAAADHSIIVPVGDVAALADGILQILEPLYRIGAAAYHAKTWSDTAAKLQRLLSGDCVASATSFDVDSTSVGVKPVLVGSSQEVLS